MEQQTHITRRSDLAEEATVGAHTFKVASPKAIPKCYRKDSSPCLFQRLVVVVVVVSFIDFLVSEIPVLCFDP